MEARVTLYRLFLFHWACIMLQLRYSLFLRCIRVMAYRLSPVSQGMFGSLDNWIRLALHFMSANSNR